MRPLNVAVVGLGIGRSHIVEGWAPNADAFRVTALCDLDPARLAAVGDEFAIAGRTQRFEDLLADPAIDIIDVCTPPALHRPQAVAALAAGKHVVCEKPLTGSLADCDAIIAAERAAKGVLMPIFQYRYGDGIGQAKAIIDAGIAGEPIHGAVETFWLRGPDYYAVPWRGRWETELGGVLVTHALHLHDMALCLMGDVASVQARVATRVNPIEVEDCAVAAVELTNGALLSLSCTLASRQQISRLRLHFRNVTFESSHEPYAPGRDPWTIHADSDATRRRIDDLLAGWTPTPPRFQTQMRHFAGFLAGREPLPVTSLDARRALELVTAIYQSSEEGRAVRTPIGPDSPWHASWRPGRTKGAE